MSDLTNYDLIVFDIDGTIADRDTHKLLPNVKEWFEEYSYKKIAFISNQGGVGLRFWMEGGNDGPAKAFGEPDEFPTQSEALDHLYAVISKLSGGPFRYYTCYAYQSKKSGKWSPIPVGKESHSEWNSYFRKPNPGMLCRAITEMDVLRSRTLFVGNGEEDKEAAMNAGVDFVHADVFFNREDLTVVLEKE